MESKHSLPGAIGMYGLSLGIQRLDEVLPDIVYAFLSGLNASTVGVVALAAVQVCNFLSKNKPRHLADCCRV